MINRRILLKIGSRAAVAYTGWAGMPVSDRTAKAFWCLPLEEDFSLFLQVNNLCSNLGLSPYLISSGYLRSWQEQAQRNVLVWLCFLYIAGTEAHFSWPKPNFSLWASFKFACFTTKSLFCIKYSGEKVASLPPPQCFCIYCNSSAFAWRLLHWRLSLLPFRH